MKDFTEIPTHPSFGMLQFNRAYGSSGRALFGSSIKHSNVITLRITQGSVNRGLSENWFFGGKSYVEAEMSYSQFAEAISSFGMGSGVPITLKYVNGERIEDCPFFSTIERFQEEFKERQDSAAEVLKDGIKTAKKLLSEKKSFGKKDIEELLGILEHANREQGGNATFIYDQFNRQMEKTVTEAKGEVEAFVQSKLHSITMDALANGSNVEEIDAPKLD